jgi:hypothetical protein
MFMKSSTLFVVSALWMGLTLSASAQVATPVVTAMPTAIATPIGMPIFASVGTPIATTIAPPEVTIGVAEMVPTPIATSNATPVATSLPSLANSEIRSRIKAQESRIKAESRVGKLLTVQVNVLLAESASIKAQLKANYAENGKRELTAVQKADLSARLDANEKKIYEQDRDTAVGVNPAVGMPTP